ncbi:MAG: hypothetical protein H8E26_05125 [FCB group bacterium]|nr:hypothetical protein [FCB group bacterium]MBL7027641.1 hypothetical protein [Candidatus Neomarinimicrobiota bacterium]MBL7121112.1 hypothetical protein [Candidatus Neomarinimicrobiota bacterium]
MNIWFGVTMVSAFIVSALAAYLGVRALQVLKVRKAKLEEGGEIVNIPMAILQQRSLWNILSITIGVLIISWLFKGYAVSEFFANDKLRISITAVVAVTLMVNLFLMLPTSKKGRWSKMFDERDELVLSKASNFQIVGLLILSVIWTIGLTEYYWEAGSIPIDIPYLMFWSNFLMLFLSRSVGIVFGYWWLDHYGN